MQIQAMEKLAPDDLKAINQIAHAEFNEDDLFTFRAKLIDDKPTANGRIWSKEWQKKNAGNFVGVPVLVNHDNDQSKMVGRVFAAEQKDNAIYGKVYVPLQTNAGREGKANIDVGLYKSVSINASGKSKVEGEYTRIMPGDNDRVFEVSFVAVGGCKECEIIKESAPVSHCECATKTESARDQWAEYAEQIHAEATTEFIRLAGFAIGEGFKRETYTNIAKRLDPQSLKTLTDDYRRVCADRKQHAETGSNAATQVREKIQSIKKAKGI